VAPGVIGDQDLNFRLRVNDGNINSEPVDITIIVEGNQAPIALASISSTVVNSGETVTLDGTGSTDPEGDTLTYIWTQFDVPRVDLSDVTSVSPTFTAPDVTEDTILRFSLVVDDGSQRSLPVFLEITVRPLGTITIVQTTGGNDGQFTFASNTAELNTTITTDNGIGEFSVDLRAGTHIITAADASAEGFALTDLVCNDPETEIALAQRQATIVLQGGEEVTCTFSSVNSRAAAQTAIQQALLQRNRLLLANQPSASRRLDRLKGQVSQGSGVSVAGLPILTANAVPLSARVSNQGGYLAASLLGARGSSAKTGKGSWDIWAEGTLANFDSLGQDGRFSVLYVGADYVANEKLLIGALVQLDDFKSESDTQVGDVDGNGFMIGPYATARLSKNIYVDGRVAWGESDNSISPLGTFVDDFETDRFLIAGSVTGDFNLDRTWNIRPTVSLRNLSENQKAYTDSLGVSIPEQTISTSEVSFSPRVEKQIALNNGWTVRPYGSVEGIISFGDEIQNVFENSLRARFETGATWVSESGVTAGISAFADGIGSDSFSAEGIRVSISYTMK